MRDVQEPSEPSTPIDKGIQSDLGGIAELEPESSTSPTLTTMVPKHPVLPEYSGTKFSSESFTRGFQPDWYKKYPWLSYDVEKDMCVCFACIEFGKDPSFVFKNWKKSSKLTKHSQSENHVSCMTKWLQFKAMERKNSSVLQQLSNAHKEQVKFNRKYLQVIIECLIFTAMQNIAVRGHEESRNDIWEVSDINRGNFLELLHLRCKDLPWLQSKLQTQLQLHTQWTSLTIQNELLAIVSDLVRGYFGIIMDETSDISRTEEVSSCLRYVISGETKENSVGFFATASTEREVLYELAKTAINNLDSRLENITAECFDGAANMSGIRKSLATRMKECSSLGIYVHCYGYLLNLALQDTMTEIETLRNALGTIQSLYNFLHTSTKRHALFKDIEVHEEEVALILKSLSTTRWSCRWAAVRAVLEQVPRIMEALVTLSKDRDPKTYNASNSLLHSICDFEFDYGLMVLKLISSNTDNLSRYLQGEQMDVITSKKTADAVVKTLSNCRNEESFIQKWSHADVIAQKKQNRNRGYEIYLQRCQGASNQTITSNSGPYWRDTRCSKRQLTTDGKRPLSYHSLFHKY